MYFVHFNISAIWCRIYQHAFLRTWWNWTDTSVLNAIRDQLYDIRSHLLCNWVGLIELNWIHIPLWGIASAIKCRGFELICTSKLKDNCQPTERTDNQIPKSQSKFRFSYNQVWKSFKNTLLKKPKHSSLKWPFSSYTSGSVSHQRVCRQGILSFVVSLPLLCNRKVS